MHLYLVCAHPSKYSFTFEVLNYFIEGLKESGNTFEIGDLYEMNFKSELDKYHILAKLIGSPKYQFLLM